MRSTQATRWPMHQRKDETVLPALTGGNGRRGTKSYEMNHSQYILTCKKLEVFYFLLIIPENVNEEKLARFLLVKYARSTPKQMKVPEGSVPLK